MNEVLRRWLKELRAIGARPPQSALEELLRAPSLPEQAVSYWRARQKAGVRTADVVRELGALARVIGCDPRVLEAMARVAGQCAAEPPLTEALALLEEGLVVLDADGAVRLASGPQPATPDLARRALSIDHAENASFWRNDRFYETEARPLHEDGELRGAAQVFRDRSRRTRLERDLQRADRELAALQARLAHSGHLQALADVASGAALALNNELNAIALVLPLLRAAHDDADRERRLATLEAAVRRAASLVDRLQQLAAPRPGVPARQIDLNRLLMEALDLVRPELTAAADQRRVRVDARLGTVPPVLARASSLRELLSSLLVQARDAGDLLIVRTRALEDHGEVELRYPVPPRERRILDELALEGARQLAAAAGAELVAQREGADEVLRVRLPLAAAKVEPRPVRARRLLVVDDDDDNRQALAELLSLLGHQVTAVSGAAEALKAAAAQPFDAALLDFAMPEMNGLELARRLRQNAAQMRLALITGWEQTPAAPGEVDAVFHKPLDVPALQAFLGDELQSAAR